MAQKVASVLTAIAILVVAFLWIPEPPSAGGGPGMGMPGQAPTEGAAPGAPGEEPQGATFLSDKDPAVLDNIDTPQDYRRLLDGS